MDGNGYPKQEPSAAAKSFEYQGNQERSDPESVSKVESVVVTGTKAALLVGYGCGVLVGS